jgi:hypothetical protein
MKPVHAGDDPSRYAKTLPLVRTWDQAYIASVIVALDAEHIQHLEQQSGTPWAPVTTVLVRELDVRRAKEAIQDLQYTSTVTPSGVSPTRSPAAVRWLGKLLIALLLLGVAIGVSSVVAQWFRN